MHPRVIVPPSPSFYFFPRTFALENGTHEENSHPPVFPLSVGGFHRRFHELCNLRRGSCAVGGSFFTAGCPQPSSLRSRMTSASELFYSRRSRSIRSPEPVIRLLPADLERHRDRERGRNREHYPDYQRPPRREHRRRLHHNDCGSPRQFPHGAAAHGIRHLCDRGGLHTELGAGESGLGSNITSGQSRVRLSTSDRLPGAVLQARARLLERLRGISLTGSRQNAPSSDISWDEFVASEYVRVVDLGDWETDAFEAPGPGPSFVVDSIPPADRVSPRHGLNGKKPPGLTSEAIDMLQREVFRDPSGSNPAPKASSDCPICLEKFLESEVLIQLACGHRFHPECLTPWVQTCGDCPYCRWRIPVNTTTSGGRA